MGSAIALRDDFSAQDLRRLAKASKDADQSRRLLALALIYAGGSRTEAAWLGAVELQSVRDWVLRFNGKGPDGLIDPKAPGKPAKLNDHQRQALAALVEAGPIPAIHDVVRWRLSDLRQWIWQTYAISLDETNVSRELKGLGYVKITARPRHQAQNELVLEGFKKTSPPKWRKSAPSCRPTPR
jgi:transposase